MAHVMYLFSTTWSLSWQDFLCSENHYGKMNLTVQHVIGFSGKTQSFLVQLIRLF